MTSIAEPVLKKQKKVHTPEMLPEPSAEFPIDLSKFVPMKIDPWSTETLSPEQKETWKKNIQLCRDAIVVFTACGKKSGYGGHTGGAFDTVPEVLLMDAFFVHAPRNSCRCFLTKRATASRHSTYCLFFMATWVRNNCATTEWDTAACPGTQNLVSPQGSNLALGDWVICGLCKRYCDGK